MKNLYYSNFSKNITIIFFLILIKIESLPYLQTLPTIDNRYYIVFSRGIVFMNNFSNNFDWKHEFNDDQIITSEEDFEKIYLKNFNNKIEWGILIVKNYIYDLSLRGNIFCNKKLEEINGFLSGVVTIEWQEATKKSYYVVVLKNTNNKLALYLYENDSYNTLPTCKTQLYDSKEFNEVSSDNINCHYGTSFICFYEDNSNKIVANYFNIDLVNKKIENSSSYSKDNGGAKFLKSIMSPSGTKYYICYTKDDSNGDCLIFDLNTNAWTDPINYLNNCLLKVTSLNLKLFDSLNYILLSCFQSETTFQIIKFNNNFEKMDDEQNGLFYLDESLVQSCTESSLSSLVNDTDQNIIKIFGNCDFTPKKYEIIKIIDYTPTSIPIYSTIISTIPETPETTIIYPSLSTNIYNPETSFINPSLSTNIYNPVTTFIYSSDSVHISNNIDSSVVTYSSIVSTLILSNDNDEDDLNIIQMNNEDTKEDILNNINNVLDDYDLGQNYEIFGNDYKIKIGKINSKLYKNISTYIDFSSCEKELRKINKLNDSHLLTIFQMEIDNPNNQRLIDDVRYFIFNEEKQPMDLSACENEDIEIHYQLNTSMINFEKVNYYNELGIDVFNIEDVFFNDICYPHSENGSDMILKDRVSDIFENYSLCENNCKYIRVNLTSNMSTCKCSIKTSTDSKTESPTLSEIIRDTFKDSNLAVIICYKLVFSFKNKLENYGFLIFTIIVLAHFPLFIHYLRYNIFYVIKYVFSEMSKYKYWNGINSPPKKNSRKKINLEYDKKNNSKGKDSKDNINCRIHKFKQIGNIESKYKTNSTYSNENLINSNCKKKLNKFKSKMKNNKNKLSNRILLFDYKVYNKNYINLKGKKNKQSSSTINTHNEKNKLQKTNIKERTESLKIYSLIQMNADNSATNHVPRSSNMILDIYDYKTAIRYDKRSFWRILYICIITKENILNILIFKTPLDIQSLRICLFIFTYSCDLAFNTIFYSNQNISDKYHYKGKNIILFTIVNNFLQSLISTFVSIIMINIFQNLIDSRGKFEDIFREEEQKMRKNKNYKVSKETKSKIKEEIRKISHKLRLKIIIYMILEFIILLFFYYFVTAFCEVYKQTQMSWLLDFLISFLISIAFEIAEAIILAIFYILALKYRLKIVYNIVIFFYNI